MVVLFFLYMPLTSIFIAASVMFRCAVVGKDHIIRIIPFMASSTFAPIGIAAGEPRLHSTFDEAVISCVGAYHKALVFFWTMMVNLFRFFKRSPECSFGKNYMFVDKAIPVPFRVVFILYTGICSRIISSTFVVPWIAVASNVVVVDELSHNNRRFLAAAAFAQWPFKHVGKNVVKFCSEMTKPFFGFDRHLALVNDFQKFVEHFGFYGIFALSHDVYSFIVDRLVRADDVCNHVTGLFFLANKSLCCKSIHLTEV